MFAAAWQFPQFLPSTTSLYSAGAFCFCESGGMAAELLTPIDEQSGLPLSIAPVLETLPRDDPNVANWHHLFHPRSAEELQSIGGWALRNSRVQLLRREDHNFGTHTYHTFFKGPELPDADDQAEQFRLCVLSCAGYIPSEVIDISGTEPSVRLVSDAEHAFFRASPLPQPVSSIELRRQRAAHDLPDRKLWRMLNLRHERQAMLSYNDFRYAYDPIRDFFTQYLLQKEMLDVRPAVIDKFLQAPDERTRRSIGELLLDRVATVATSNLVTTYKKFHESGSLHQLMPPQPEELVKNKLGNRDRRQQLLFEFVQAERAAA